MNVHDICISEDLVLTAVPGQMLEVIVTDPLQDFTDLFKEEHWGWRPTGQGGMIFSRVDIDDWYSEPTTLDNPELPKKAIERANAILERGIRVQGWIIGHEVGEAAERAKVVNFETVAKIVAAITLFAVGGVLALLLLPFVVLAFGFVLLHADPVLCAVLSDEEQTIVEFYRWIDG